mmetsp:Transcript_3210/g.8884  ORF Transcript_3210/g.8884 Transcript_3210/m.8884 type:complete len:222 (+) Transcript_3210:469-1134(+)
MSDMIWWRPWAFGRLISNIRGSRRRMASSTCLGRLVAPSTMTGPLDSWLFPDVVIPSQRVRNSALMAFPALFSAPSRGFRKVSSSSIKIMDGASLLARLKMASMNLLDSPNHLLMILESLTARNVASASLAMALASMVFPVPGGPYNKMPPGACSNPDWAKSSGCWRGRTASSQISCFLSSSPPMSENPTEMSAGSITSWAICRSYEVRGGTSRPCSFMSL